MNEERLRKIIVDALVEVAPDVDPAALDPRAEFRAQFDFDSMDTLNFVTALHRSLGVDVPESDYARLASVEEALAYLSPRLQEPAPP